MDKLEAEKVIKLFTETSKDKRHAFIRGVLYGLGFCEQSPEPNWVILEDLIRKGKDDVGWIDIEKSVFEVYKKVTNGHIVLWKSVESDLYGVSRSRSGF